MNTPRYPRRHARSCLFLAGAALSLGGLPVATPLAAQTKLLTFEDNAYVVGASAVDTIDPDLGTGEAWKAKVTGSASKWTVVSGGASSAKALRLTDDNASGAYGYYLDFANCGVDFDKTFTVSFKLRLTGVHARFPGTRQARIHFGRNDGPGVWDLTKNWLTLEAHNDRYHIHLEGGVPDGRAWANIAPIPQVAAIPANTPYTEFRITVDPVKKRYANVMVNGMDVTSRVLAVNGGALPWRLSASDTAAPNHQFWVLSGSDDVVNVDVDDVRVSNQAEPWVATAAMPEGLGAEWLEYLTASTAMAVPQDSILNLEGMLNVASGGHALINSRGFAELDQDGELSFVSGGNGEKVRLFCAAEVMLDFPLTANAPDSHLQTYVDQIARAGYNAYRPHFLDVYLMEGSTTDGQFNEARWAQWQKLVEKLRAKGIYLVMDASTAWCAFYGTQPFYSDTARLKRLKVKLAYDQATRDHWKAAVSRLYTETNPNIAAGSAYKGLAANTCLAKDPQVVFTNVRNEAGLIFQLGADTVGTPNSVNSPVLSEEPGLLARWRQWLRGAYGDDLAELKTKWKDATTRTLSVLPEAYTSFDDIPIPSVKAPDPDPDKNEHDWNDWRDLRRFEVDLEQDVHAWMLQTMRGLGLRSLIVDHNVGSDLPGGLIRDTMTMADNHAYSDHGSAGAPGSGVEWRHNNKSATDDALLFVRDAGQARQSGRPYVITEWSQPYWNPFRYEAGLAFPAYAALQGWSMIAQHGQPLSRFNAGSGTMAVDPAQVFKIRSDPAAKASEYMAAFLYGRGDVATSPHHVEVVVNPMVDVVHKNRWGFDYGFKALPLLTRFGMRVEWPAVARDDFADGVVETASGVNEPSWNAFTFWTSFTSNNACSVASAGGKLLLTAANTGHPSAMVRTKATSAAPMDFFAHPRQIFLRGIQFETDAVEGVPPAKQMLRVAVTNSDNISYNAPHAIVLEIRGNNHVRIGYKINSPTGLYDYVETIADLPTAPGTIQAVTFTPIASDLNEASSSAEYDPTYDLIIHIGGAGSQPAVVRRTGRWHKNSPPAAKKLTPANWTGLAANTLQIEAQKMDALINGKFVRVSCDEFALRSRFVGPRALDYAIDHSWSFSAQQPEFPSVVDELKSAQLNVLNASSNQTVSPDLSDRPRKYYASGVYHSDTEQLRLEPAKRLFTVVTPRSQGATVPAFLADGTATPATMEPPLLPDLRIESRPAPVLRSSFGVLVTSRSPDLEKTVRTSERLLLIVSTDAINTEQTFADYRRLSQLTTSLEKGWGRIPVLLRRANMELRLRNDNAATLKVYPLMPNGQRRSGVVLPTTVETDNQGAQWLVIPIDTGAISGGPAVYFEIGA